MKFVCISDTHTQHWDIEVPDGDVLIHAGDFTNRGTAPAIKDFAAWLDKQPHPYKVVIAGNHDKLFEHDPELAESLLPPDVAYLNQSGVEIEGIKIWGEPRQPTFGYGWAFNVNRSQSHEHWSLVPDDTNILVTHGPPHGCGDLVKDFHSMSWATPNLIHVGCKEMKEMIKAHEHLRYVICGHIHEGYGKWVVDGNINVLNVVTCNLRYEPVNKPVEFEYEV